MSRDTAATPETPQDSEEICCDTCSTTGGPRTRVQLRLGRLAAQFSKERKSGETGENGEAIARLSKL